MNACGLATASDSGMNARFHSFLEANVYHMSVGHFLGAGDTAVITYKVSKCLCHFGTYTVKGDKH